MPTPPEITSTIGEGRSSAFDIATVSYATLYVPVGAKKDYEVAEWWKEFINIEEMNFSGVASVGREAVSVVADGGRIVVSGVGSNASMEVYSAAGQLVYRGAATTISIVNRGICIVRIAG